MTLKAASAPPKRSSRTRTLEGQLERANKTIEALRQVGIALGSNLHVGKQLELIVEKIKTLLEADTATLYKLDRDGLRLTSDIIVGGEKRVYELPVGVGIAGTVAQLGQTIRVKNAYRDKRFNREWDKLSGYRTRSILAAPMRDRAGQIIGVIQIINKVGDDGSTEFTEADAALLSAFASQAAVAIEKLRLFEKATQSAIKEQQALEHLERSNYRQQLLLRIESVMAHAATMEDLARAAIVEAAQVCGADAGGLLIDEGEQGLGFYFINLSIGPNASQDQRQDAAEVRRVPMKRGEGMVGHAMTHNAAVLPGAKAVTISARVSRILGVEIITGIARPLDEAIGVIALYKVKDPSRGADGNYGEFTDGDSELLHGIAANASTAVRLFRERFERERSERLSSIGRLLSGVMHDMRTPLTVISGYVQLMATTADAKTRQEHARIILQQFDAIGAMQREVLEYARGERTVLIRKVYIARFFGDIEKQLAPECAEANVRLVVKVQDRGTARFDEGKFTRVIHNLARNAIEAMGKSGGTFTITVKREGYDLILMFTDTGHGLPKEMEGRLFQSFASSGKRGGTGLGLSIVKNIVDEHNGTITVESSRRGATFTIRLPQDATTQPSPQRPGPEPHVRRQRVPAA